MRILIVGAGLGGLSAACHLSGQGHEVVVVEKASVPGGRAGVIESDGFRFDTGPTVLTMTGILRNTFAAAGASMEDHLDLIALDPMYRACFSDGSEILCRRGIEAMRDEIAAKASTHDADGFVRFSKWLTELYEAEMPHFIDRNFDSPASMLRPIKPLAQLVRLGGLRKLSNVVADYFDDERLQRIFSFQAMYAGLSPFTALAIYGVITYMDSVEGVYFPKGGMHSVSVGLAEAASAAGTKVLYDTAVERIVHNTAGVQGVRTEAGELISADAVIVNADLPFAYKHLLPDLSPPRVAANGDFSPSCLVWIAGVRGTLPERTAHHNIHFGEQWRGAFDALLTDGKAMPDPSILVTVPSHSDPALAPGGRHSLYALEPMPNLEGRIDWKRERDKRVRRLTKQLRDLGYPTNVEVEHVTDPRDWQALGLERGTPFSLSHRFSQTGPFRPRNVESRVPGLYFTGSGTTPGVGVPTVLLSGRLVAERIATA